MIQRGRRGHLPQNTAEYIQPEGDDHLTHQSAFFAELFQDKLSKSEAQVVWKDYSPSHFAGATGTFTGIDESIPGIPAREKCEPTSVGEFWCASGASVLHFWEYTVLSD